MTPEDPVAEAIARALSADFPEREATALLFAELLLDAVDAALPLTLDLSAGPPLAQLELLATGADVYSWEGAPGWDEVLARGLEVPSAIAPGPSVVDGLGARAARDEQHRELVKRARLEAATLLRLGRAVAQPGSASATVLVQTHSSLLRLFGHAALAPLFELPEDPLAGELLRPAVPAEETLCAEMDSRAASGSEFGSAGEEWLARLTAQNASAAHPLFRRFFAGLSQTLRTALALRELRDRARATAGPAITLTPGSSAALLGAIGGWQPVRWAELRAGAPADWIAQLCPATALEEPGPARLARECSAALELAGRLWLARDLSLTGFTALASLFTARCASVVALWQELGGR